MATNKPVSFKILGNHLHAIRVGAVPGADTSAKAADLKATALYKLLSSFAEENQYVYTAEGPYKGHPGWRLWQVVLHYTDLPGKAFSDILNLMGTWPDALWQVQLKETPFITWRVEHPNHRLQQVVHHLDVDPHADPDRVPADFDPENPKWEYSSNSAIWHWYIRRDNPTYCTGTTNAIWIRFAYKPTPQDYLGLGPISHNRGMGAGRVRKDNLPSWVQVKQALSKVPELSSHYYDEDYPNSKPFTPRGWHNSTGISGVTQLHLSFSFYDFYNDPPKNPSAAKATIEALKALPDSCYSLYMIKEHNPFNDFDENYPGPMSEAPTWPEMHHTFRIKLYIYHKPHGK